MTRLLIKNATILSMDPTIGDLERGDVLVEDDRIAAVAAEIAAEDAEIIDAAGCIVMPGLVHAHIHTWQTALRGLGADWAGSDYYNFFHATLAPRYRPEDTYIGTLMGALAQIETGVTTIFDWCHNNATPAHTDAAVDALFDSGIRAIFGHGTVKPQPQPGQPHFSQVPHPVSEIERLRRGRLSSDDGLVTLAMCILGPDYSTLEVCRHDFAAAREFGLLSSAHVWGRPNRLVPGGYITIAKEGLLGPDHVLVHGNYIEDDELRVIVDSGATAVSTVAVELSNHVREPLIGRMRRMGGLAGIGIDSEVGHGGTMFEVARLTLQMLRLFENQRTVQAAEANQDARRAEFQKQNLKVIGTGGSVIEKVSVRAREALQWATIDNAQVMRLDHRIGSLTPGKQADLIVIRRDSLNMLAVHDPVQAALFYAQPSDVETVLIAGRFAKRHGRLTSPHAGRGRELMQSAAALLGQETGTGKKAVA